MGIVETLTRMRDNAEHNLKVYRDSVEEYYAAVDRCEDYNEEWADFNELDYQIKMEELSHKIDAYNECLATIKKNPEYKAIKKVKNIIKGM